MSLLIYHLSFHSLLLRLLVAFISYGLFHKLAPYEGSEDNFIAMVCQVYSVCGVCSVCSPGVHLRCPSGEPRLHVGVREVYTIYGEPGLHVGVREV